MRIFVICLTVALTSAGSFHKKETCDMLDCRAGRECVIDDGVAQCLCVISCPDHHKPVCGNDGESYANHCLLHQHACITNSPISIEHKGYCKSKYKSLKKDNQFLKDKKHSMISKKELGDKLEHDLVDSIKRSPSIDLKSTESRKGPAACFSSQRDAMRYLMVGYWNQHVDKQLWFKGSMGEREELWGYFYTCDTFRDGLMTPLELLECAKDVDFFPRPGQNKMETKALCIEAIIDDADVNRDAMLDFNEFAKVMNQKYQPKEKKCSLDGKFYTDGKQVDRNCNKCICAIGSWICTPSDCKPTQTNRNENHVFRTDDFDNELDEKAFANDFRSFDIKHSKNDLSYATGFNTNFDEDLENGIDFAVKDDESIDETADSEINENDVVDYDYDMVDESKKKSKKESYMMEKAMKKLKLLEKETKVTKEMIKQMKKEKNKKSNDKSYDRKQKKMKEMKKSNRKMKKEKKMKDEKSWMELLHFKNYDVSKFRENGVKSSDKIDENEI